MLDSAQIHQIQPSDPAVVLTPEVIARVLEGHMHPLKRGTVLYAMRSGVPIYPVAIVGTKILYFRKRLTLRFGPPVQVPHEPLSGKPLSGKPLPGELLLRVYAFI